MSCDHFWKTKGIGETGVEVCECGAVFLLWEGDVSYGDYTTAEQRLAEVDDVPEAQEVFQKITDWAFDENEDHSTETARRAKIAFDHACKIIGEAVSDAEVLGR